MASGSRTGLLSIVVKPAIKIICPPEAYKNDTEPRGACIIINCKKFNTGTKLKERLGSDIDVENIKNLFSQIGYYLLEYIEDPTRDSLKEKLNLLSQEDILHKVDSFVCICMSHGGQDYIFTADGQLFPLADIYSAFNDSDCPAVAEKPKLFVIQACRGNFNPDRTSDRHNDAGSKGNVNEHQPACISNLGVLHSTRRNFVSNRHPTNGSDFLIELCNSFMDFAKDHAIYPLHMKINNLLKAKGLGQQCSFEVSAFTNWFYLNPIGRKDVARETKTQKSTRSQSHEGQDDPGGSTSFHQYPGNSGGSSGTTNRFESVSGSTGKSSMDNLEVEGGLTSYRFQDNCDGLVLVINNIPEFKNDVEVLLSLFNSRNYQVKELRGIDSYDKLRRIADYHSRNIYLNVIVVFFGYGYGNHVFISESESVLYHEMCHIFRPKSKDHAATVVLTEVYFRPKDVQTVAHQYLEHDPEDVYHLGLRMNNMQSKKASFLTTCLSTKFEEEKNCLGFQAFSLHFTNWMKSLQEEGCNVRVKFYGVKRYFYFYNMNEECATQSTSNSSHLYQPRPAITSGKAEIQISESSQSHKSPDSSGLQPWNILTRLSTQIALSELSYRDQSRSGSQSSSFGPISSFTSGNSSLSDDTCVEYQDDTCVDYQVMKYQPLEISDGLVLVISNIPEIGKDVEELLSLFRLRNYHAHELREIDSYEKLRRVAEQYSRKSHLNVIVVFFGFGHANHVFINQRDIVSYQELCNLFRPDGKGHATTVLLTEVYSKPENIQTVVHQHLDSNPEDVYHLGLRMNNTQPRAASLLTSCLSSKFKEEKDCLGFESFSLYLTNWMTRFPKEQYEVRIKLFGVKRDFFFYDMKKQPTRATKKRKYCSAPLRPQPHHMFASMHSSSALLPGYYDYSSPQVEYFSRLLSIHLVVSKRVLHRVFLMGHADFFNKLSSNPRLTLYEYYEGKGVRTKILLKSWSGMQRQKIQNDPWGISFDVSLLSMCIQHGSEGVANFENDKWRKEEYAPCLEWYLTAVRNVRNKLMHSDPIINYQDFLTEVEELHKLLKNVIQEAGKLYGLSVEDIKREVKSMSEDLDGFRDKPFVEDYKKKVNFEDFSELIRTECRADLVIQYGKMKRIIITPVSNLEDINFHVRDVFTRMVLHDETDKDNKTDLLLKDILYHCKDGKHHIFLLEGNAGVGKTTLSRKILHSWIHQNESEIENLKKYDLLLHMECSNRRIKSFFDLIQGLMPNVMSKYRAMDVTNSVLRQRILILVEAFDELNDHSAKLVHEILDLKKRYNIDIMITTRPEKIEFYFRLVKPLNFKTKHIELLGIPEEKWDDFVCKYYSEMSRVSCRKIPAIEGLLSYLCRTGQRLRELWRLPYNLALLVILWVHNSSVVNTITTSSELYWEIHLLCLMKLKESLSRHRMTLHLDDSSLDEKTSCFIKTLSREALLGLVTDDITLTAESHKQLVYLCLKEDIPDEEMLGAFLKKITTMTFNRYDVRYSFPHKELQDFLSALHVFDKLKDESRGIAVRDSNLRTYLEQLHGSASLAIGKFQNTFLILIGIIYLHEKRRMDVQVKVEDSVKEEILLLLQETGIQYREEWLSVLDSAKCDAFVAKFISQVPGVIEGLSNVEDSNIFAYISLLSELQEVVETEEETALVNIELDNDDGISELLPHVVRLKLPVEKINFKSSAQKLSSSLPYEDALIDILRMSEVHSYTGVMTRRMTLPASMKYLKINVPDAEAYQSLQSFLQSDHDIYILSVILQHDFDCSVLRPLPDIVLKRHSFKSTYPQPSIYIVGVDSDEAVQNACNIVKCLQPTNGEKTLERIHFPKAKVTYQMIENLLRGMAGVGIRQGLVFPYGCMPDHDSVVLVDMAKNLFCCNQGIEWGSSYGLPIDRGW